MEISVFSEKNLQKFRVLFVGKHRFVIKIPVLTPKTRFSRRKEYFTSEILFYSGNPSFCREKHGRNFVFFSLEKRPFRNKNTSFNTKTRFSGRKEYFTSEIVFLQWKPQFLQRKTCRNFVFFSLAKTVS